MHQRGTFFSPYYLFSILSLSCLIGSSAQAATQTVMVNTDNVASPPVGSLRAAMLSSASGDTINFANTLSGNTIALAGDLPVINVNLTIDASALASPVIINGGSGFQAFFIQSGPVVLKNLTINHAAAIGGVGGANPSSDADGGGGGGGGL